MINLLKHPERDPRFAHVEIDQGPVTGRKFANAEEAFFWMCISTRNKAENRMGGVWNEERCCAPNDIRICLKRKRITGHITRPMDVALEYIERFMSLDGLSEGGLRSFELAMHHLENEMRRRGFIEEDPKPSLLDITEDRALANQHEDRVISDRDGYAVRPVSNSTLTLKPKLKIETHENVTALWPPLE